MSRDIKPGTPNILISYLYRKLTQFCFLNFFYIDFESKLFTYFAEKSLHFKVSSSSFFDFITVNNLMHFISLLYFYEVSYLYIFKIPIEQKPLLFLHTNLHYFLSINLFILKLINCFFYFFYIAIFIFLTWIYTYNS